MAEQFSWVPLPSCPLPGDLFPIKSLALSACVSPQTIHFHVLYKSPLLGPGRGPPSYNRNMCEISVRGCMLSCFSWVQLFATLWTVACQAPLSVGFSKREYWSGLPCPPPGDPETQGSNLCLCHLSPLLYWQGGSSPLASPGKPHLIVNDNT